MKKLLLIWLIVSGLITVAFGQEKTEDFKPNGNPLALIFTNFNSEFVDGDVKPTFEITRAYLGYEYNFSKKWYAKAVLDVGDPEAGKHQMAAFLKNAYMQYKNNKFTVAFGLISTTQFKVSEKIWGYRYIEKSFQDAYKFNSSADIGFNLDYDFCDYFSADFSVINGEGYKKLQADKYLRPGFGITAIPVKNVTARVFVDYMGKDVKQQSLATFLAYTGKNLIVGAEYNYQQNYDMKNGQDIYGTSFYATFIPTENVNIFFRYDDLKSKTLVGESSPWQLNKDGQLFMAGLELNPVKGVKIAPNLRLWNPADDARPNSTYAYLNLELKF